jgi:hypothetical protein
MLPTENPWPAMIVLLCVAIVCLVQWTAKRRRIDLILAASCLLLGIGCYALDVFVETPREKIMQNIYDLTSAFQAQDVDKTISYFSPQAPERIVIQSMLSKVKVHNDLRVTDLSVTFKAANSLAISHFRANASVSATIGTLTTDIPYQPSRWELDWQREAGEWKIVKVHRLNPVTGKEIAFMAVH